MLRTYKHVEKVCKKLLVCYKYSIIDVRVRNNLVHTLYTKSAFHHTLQARREGFFVNVLKKINIQ